MKKKKCKICRETKTLDEMGDSSSMAGDGKRHQCKECINDIQKIYRERIKRIDTERIKMETRRAAKILFDRYFDIDTISKIFQVHYNTAKNLIEK